MSFFPKLGRWFILAGLMVSAFPGTGWALPTRLVLALDGIAYRDMKALQAGVTCTNFWGRRFQRQAFTAAEGYFPVSRMISTFPSVSDDAWTDIFGDRPLPGYQRTYFCTAANSEIVLNGVTTTMEHERQMDWQEQDGTRRALGYLFALHTYEHEIRMTCKTLLETTNQAPDYYVYVRASDDAQHLDRNIFYMLCLLDQRLQNLRARYRAREGHDLQIVIVSDHGHNHAGRGKRVTVDRFLEQAGYQVAQSIENPRDVILPTVGIESWVEIHNAPSETEKLTELLCHLPGADVLTAADPNQANHFLVMNFKSERATIDWNPSSNSFRYTVERGDPLHYLPVIQSLARDHQLDTHGFASANAWMTATMTNHYPMALERIVRGLTRNVLNPATILISLDNHYVNDSWLTQQGSRLVTCGSTHGGLDDLCTDGIVLSNFSPTHDTSSGKVAGQFDDFPGVKNFRAGENGAELVTQKEQALVRIVRTPFDRDRRELPNDAVLLRIWSPRLVQAGGNVPVEVTIEKIKGLSTAPTSPGGTQAAVPLRRQITFDHPVFLAGENTGERVYTLPPDLILEPRTAYRISGCIHAPEKTIDLFAFNFATGKNGRPAAF